MGFFSSRRTECSSTLPSHQDPSRDAASTTQENSVTYLIRSRFYRKSSIFKKSSRKSEGDVRPPYAPSVTSIAEDHQLEQADSYVTSNPTLTRQVTADTHRNSLEFTSMTLAQRLDELGVANSEGLLDDDEFRLLRQNIFERYSLLSTGPSDPSVPSLGTASLKTNSSSSRAGDASIRTHGSVRSAVSSMIRRATSRSRRNGYRGAAATDSESTFSFKSRESSHLPVPHQLGRQVSSVSLNARSSRPTPDVRSVTSTKSLRSFASSSERFKENWKGLARSIRNGEPPPSSFTTHRFATWAQGDGSLSSARSIQMEIAETEAEAQRLLDAFNGLEISVLARNHANQLSTTPSDGRLPQKDSTWMLIPDQASAFGPDVYCAQKISDRGQSMLRTSTLRLTELSSSSAVSHVQTSRGLQLNDTHLTMDDSEYSSLVKATMLSEVENIRRRKIDITDRYQQRLDYLRARLKGAEIHEKLTSK